METFGFALNGLLLGIPRRVILFDMLVPRLQTTRFLFPFAVLKARVEQKASSPSANRAQPHHKTSFGMMDC